MTKRQGKSGTIDIKAVLAEDEEFLRALVRIALQEVLEAEMTEALGAEKGERASGRQGYRSGYYGRTLITRVGKLELRVPQDRAGRFSTELFERYQRCLPRGPRPTRAPIDAGDPVGYTARIADPDGHSLELSFGQEVGLAVRSARKG